MKFLVASGAPVVRKGFQEVARSKEGWEIVEAGDAGELLVALQSASLDAVVLDLPFGERSAFDLVAEIGACVSLPMLVMAPYPEPQYAMAFLRAGASGFLRRSATVPEIVAALASVAAGARYIHPRVASSRNHDKQPHERLSARELEVFRLLAVGRAPTDIANSLDLSVKTISTYRSRILEKTGFRSNADMVAYAIRNELV